MADFWTIGPAVASFVGAGVSVWQAWKARKAANEARTIKDNLLLEHSTKLGVQLDEAFEVTMKYHAGTTEGVSPANDVVVVQKMVAALGSGVESLGDKKFAEEVDRQKPELDTLITSFGSATGLQMQCRELKAMHRIIKSLKDIHDTAKAKKLKE